METAKHMYRGRKDKFIQSYVQVRETDRLTGRTDVSGENRLNTTSMRHLFLLTDPQICHCPRFRVSIKLQVHMKKWMTRWHKSHITTTVTPTLTLQRYWWASISERISIYSRWLGWKVTSASRWVSFGVILSICVPWWVFLCSRSQYWWILYWWVDG